jgi:hypothetical protein
MNMEMSMNMDTDIVKDLDIDMKTGIVMNMDTRINLNSLKVESHQILACSLVSIKPNQFFV